MVRAAADTRHPNLDHGHGVEDSVELPVAIAAAPVNPRGASESLNVKDAYLEVVADTAGSVGVIAAGRLVIATGNALRDNVVALVIGAFVVVRALPLGRQVLAVLAQHVPEGIDLGAVESDLTRIPGVASIHDLHLWTLTSGMNVATAHLVFPGQGDTRAVLTEARHLLRDDRRIAHTTLQIEPPDQTGCEELDW